MCTKFVSIKVSNRWQVLVHSKTLQRLVDSLHRFIYNLLGWLRLNWNQSQKQIKRIYCCYDRSSSIEFRALWSRSNVLGHWRTRRVIIFGHAGSCWSHKARSIQQTSSGRRWMNSASCKNRIILSLLKQSITNQHQHIINQLTVHLRSINLHQ